MSFTISLLLSILLCHGAHAVEFNPNCTFPPSGSTFVASPAIRSTFDILWSCLFTIFACTWTVLHLNVPPQPKDEEAEAEAEVKGWRKAVKVLRQFWRKVAKVLKSVWRKLKWMLVSIILPEFLVAKALGEYAAARNSVSCDSMKKNTRDKGKKWTKTHAFYANMGGFILCERKQTENSTQTEESMRTEGSIRRAESTRSEDSTWKEEDSTQSEEGTGSEYTDLPPCREHVNWQQFPHKPDDPEVHLPCAIDASQICIFLSNKLISDPPFISKAEIEDKSKADLFSKLVALGQVLWLIIQLIVRAVRHLPSTQLEITTLSFAVCTFIIYVLWKDKPKDVGTPTYICASRDLQPQDKGILVSMQRLTFFEKLLVPRDWADRESPKTTIRFDVYNEEASLWVVPRSRDHPKRGKLRFHFESEDLGFCLSAAAFGACHLLAWNFEFPTTIEKTLWRSASLVVATILPIQQLLLLLIWRLTSTHEGLYYALILFLSWMTMGVYIVARLYMIVEVFRDLAYLPPGAFVATWTTSIPHIG